jgi:hypothetical protein
MDRLVEIKNRRRIDAAGTNGAAEDYRWMVAEIERLRRDNAALERFRELVIVALREAYPSRERVPPPPALSVSDRWPI